MVSNEELRRREELAQFNAEILNLKGDELLDRIIAFNALPPPDLSDRNLRVAMRYTIGAALIKEFGVGKGEEAIANRLAARHEAQNRGISLNSQSETQ